MTPRQCDELRSQRWLGKAFTRLRRDRARCRTV